MNPPTNNWILSYKNGVNNPCVLDYDKSTNRLLVVNLNSTAFLFDVTRGQQKKSRTLDTIKQNDFHFKEINVTLFQVHVIDYDSIKEIDVIY